MQRQLRQQARHVPKTKWKPFGDYVIQIGKTLGLWSTDDKTKIDTKKDTPEQVVDKVFDAAKEKAMDNEAPAIHQKKTAKNKANRKKSHNTNKRMRRQRKRSRMILQVAVVVISTALMAYVGRSWIEKIKQNFIARTPKKPAAPAPASHTHKKPAAPAPASHTHKKPAAPAPAPASHTHKKPAAPAPFGHSLFSTHHTPAHSLPDEVNKEIRNIYKNFDGQRMLNINGIGVAGCGLHALNNALQPYPKITDKQIEIIVEKLRNTQWKQKIPVFTMFGSDGLEDNVLKFYINDKYNTMFSEKGLDNLEINEMNKYGAFIVNKHGHWIAIRRIHKDYDYWIKIDSLDISTFKNSKIFYSNEKVLNHIKSYVGGFAIEKTITHRS